jgi:cytochrome c oxidase cbb3-type subunit 3
VRAVGCQGSRPSRVIRLNITTAVPRPAAAPRASQVVEREKLLARLGVKQELQGELLARPRRVRTFERSAVNVKIDDPMSAHFDQLGKYTDKDMHDVFAYLDSLK